MYKEIYFSYIMLDYNPKEPFFIRGATAMKDTLLAISPGQRLSIKGLGLLEVVEVRKNVTYDNEEDMLEEIPNSYHEIGLVCKEISAIIKAQEVTQAWDEFVEERIRRGVWHGHRIYD